jgi:hypothetical protein
MTWDAWAAIGQLASALGVITSLIFVGVQVRQSVRTAKATAFQTLVSSIINVNMMTISQPGFLELVERNRKGEASAPEEHRVYVIFVLTAARLAQSAHYQMRLGLLNESQLESVVYNLVRHLNTPAGSAVWSELAKRSDPEFCRYVEALTERIDGFDSIMTSHT